MMTKIYENSKMYPEYKKIRKGIYLPEQNISKKILVRISFIALFAALTAGGTFFVIPVGSVPIVLQNMFAVLSGLILGPVMGAAAVGIFLLAGILGFPVFSGGTGGIAVLAGPTGGYLAGYFLAAVLAGLIAGKPEYKTSLPRLIIAAAAGFIVIYIPGLIWLKGVDWGWLRNTRDLSWPQTFAGGLFPFIPGDILKAIAAVAITPRLRRLAADFFNG